MKSIILIHSLLFLSGCAQVTEFPDLPFYVVDVTNQVCVKYKLTDRKKIKFVLVEEQPLVPKGPCDRALGFSLPDQNKAKNWIREQIKKTSINTEGL